MADTGAYRKGPLRHVGLALAAVLLAAAAPAVAGENHDTARALKEAGEIVPLQEVVTTAESLHPGHLLQVELERYGDRYVYEVEFVDPDGVVWKMYFDARDGSLIENGPRED